jgi:hypothetical protein
MGAAQENGANYRHTLARSRVGFTSPRSWQGDETDQATADTEAERQSRLHRTDGCQEGRLSKLLAAVQSKPPLVECGIEMVASDLGNPDDRFQQVIFSQQGK